MDSFVRERLLSFLENAILLWVKNENAFSKRNEDGSQGIHQAVSVCNERMRLKRRSKDRFAHKRKPHSLFFPFIILFHIVINGG